MDPAGEAVHGVEIEEHERYLEARFLGTFSVDRFNRQQEAAAKACEERGQSKLLVDLTGIGAIPTTTDRYEMASHAVRVAWSLKVALVAAPSFLDPRKFGIIVAQNRGLLVEAFTDRGKAIEWLLSSAGEPPKSDSEAPAG